MSKGRGGPILARAGSGGLDADLDPVTSRVVRGLLRPATDPPYRRVMVRIGAIVLNVADTARAGAFWSRALGYRHGSNPDFLVPGEDGDPRLHLDRTDRTHLDLWAADEDEQLAEVERLVELGATRVEWDYPAEADFVVLADPDCNLFCVVNAGD